MLVPAALEQWAAEHNDQLSEATIGEVSKIVETISTSPINDLSITDLGDELGEHLANVFSGARAERAATLIQVAADWVEKRPVPTADEADPDDDVANDQHDDEADPDDDSVHDTDAGGPDDDTDAADDQDADEESAISTDAESAVPEPKATELVPPGPTFAPSSALLGESEMADGRVESPAFLRSDKVDEEDDVRLYGPKWPWRAIFGTLVAIALLAGAALGGWYWFTQRDDSTETATTLPDSGTPAPDASAEPAQPASTPEPTLAATAVPEPTPVLPTFWADTTPILNSGSAQISASTYVVSPENRAVLTGHTAAITGVVVSDDGRVLTSGADQRLVDWGADVTLANPDVLNVPSPLTVLERTVDQRVIAGDAAGDVTIIDLVTTAQPLVFSVHDVAISAATELADGRLAVASADGDVAVFDVEAADDRIMLPHPVEVTAVVALPDGTIATAAVDGIIRLWASDGSLEPGEIATLEAPATALTLLADGRLASASVGGEIHVVPAVADTTDAVILPGHIGAVRSLFEITLADGSFALASGGDDTTIRLWDVASQTQLRVLEGHGDIISGLDALPDGRLVSTSGDGTGRVWDLSIAPSRSVIPPHDWNLSAIEPWDNDQFVTGGTDGKIVLASTAETSEPKLISQHDAPIVGISILQNDDIVSLDAASILRINRPSGEAAEMIEIQLAPGATALDVRDSLGVVTGHTDGSVRFHDFAEEVASIDAHGSGVNDVISLSNGLVVSAGQDKTVRIIDFDNPDQLPVFDLHTAPVDVVIELPDGRIASAGSDGIYIFTLEGLAQDHIRLNGQRARTISLVALPGDRLISTGDDGRIRLWDLTRPESEPTTLIDIPGVINPYLIQAGNGLFVAGAARGYVVFTPG